MAGPGGDTFWKQSLRGRPMWVSPEPSEEEVAALEKEFLKIIKVPEVKLRDEAARWEDTAVVARCFNRWVASDAIVREFHCSNVDGEIQAFGLARGYYILNLASPGERSKVVDRPWSINGQILAVEEWRRPFLPMEEAITAALL